MRVLIHTPSSRRFQFESHWSWGDWEVTWRGELTFRSTYKLGCTAFLVVCPGKFDALNTTKGFCNKRNTPLITEIWLLEIKCTRRVSRTWGVAFSIRCKCKVLTDCICVRRHWMQNIIKCLIVVYSAITMHSSLWVTHAGCVVWLLCSSVEMIFTRTERFAKQQIF